MAQARNALPCQQISSSSSSTVRLRRDSSTHPPHPLSSCRPLGSGAQSQVLETPWQPAEQQTQCTACNLCSATHDMLGVKMYSNLCFAMVMQPYAKHQLQYPTKTTRGDWAVNWTLGQNQHMFILRSVQCSGPPALAPTRVGSSEQVVCQPYLELRLNT